MLFSSRCLYQIRDVQDFQIVLKLEHAQFQAGNNAVSTMFQLWYKVAT